MAFFAAAAAQKAESRRWATARATRAFRRYGPDLPPSQAVIPPIATPALMRAAAP
ncbi:hypothetical protein [Xanthomonas medicagonis]|uniref:hypothetical protein n=1 Tax=Xanthomonas medicagonis TaxID=3160841 RepID=UPI003513B79D